MCYVYTVGLYTRTFKSIELLTLLHCVFYIYSFIIRYVFNFLASIALVIAFSPRQSVSWHCKSILVNAFLPRLHIAHPLIAEILCRVHGLISDGTMQCPHYFACCCKMLWTSVQLSSCKLTTWHSYCKLSTIVHCIREQFMLSFFVHRSSKIKWTRPICPVWQCYNCMSVL